MQAENVLSMKKVVSKLERICTEQVAQSALSGLVARQIDGNYILMYHGVTPNGSTRFNKRHISVHDLEAQLQFLTQNFQVVSLKDFCNGNFKNDVPAFALTFDDGYWNNLVYARPLLEKYNCPATFFVTGLNDLGDNILWADLVNVASVLIKGTVVIEDEKFIYRNDGYYSENTGKSIYAVIRYEHPYYDYKLKVKQGFAGLLKSPELQKISDYWRLMTNEEIKQVSQSSGISIGCHSYCHNNLGSMEYGDACTEIIKAKNYLENLIQQPVEQFAFPDGSYTPQLVKFNTESGFKIQLAVDRYYGEDENTPIKGRRGIYAVDSSINQVLYSIKPKEGVRMMPEGYLERGSSVNAGKLNPHGELRILLAIKSMAHGGGAESLVFNIFKELKKRPNVKVKLVAFEKSEQENIANTGFFESRLNNDPDFIVCNSKVRLSVMGGNQSDVKEFAEIVKDFKPHIIHSHLFIAELVAHENIYPHVKYFTHSHDNMKQLKNFSRQTLLKKELATNFYEKQHLVERYLKANNNFITISADTNKYFKTVLPEKLRKNIFYLENAVDIKRFAGINHKRSLDKIRIVNVGGFSVVKNQKFLVDIGAELLKRGVNFEITMLGNGVFFNEVSDKVKAKGLEKHIHMPGNVVNVEDYYRDANIYVHTSTSEAFGLVFVEAMACGLPIVSLDGKGNRGLIKDGENGYMIYEENPATFADRIMQITGNEKLYQSFSDKAVQIAGKYNIEHYVDELLKIYTEAGDSSQTEFTKA